MDYVRLKPITKHLKEHESYVITPIVDNSKNLPPRLSESDVLIVDTLYRSSIHREEGFVSPSLGPCVSTHKDTKIGTQIQKAYQRTK